MLLHKFANYVKIVRFDSQKYIRYSCSCSAPWSFIVKLYFDIILLSIFN